MAAPAAARGRRGQRLLRPSARPPAVPQCRAADAPSPVRPSRASARPHARAACARIASVQSAPGLGQREQHEQRDQGAGAATRSLSAVAGISAPLPPLPSTSSHPSTSFPRPLCGEKESPPHPASPPAASLSPRPWGCTSMGRQPRPRQSRLRTTPGPADERAPQSCLGARQLLMLPRQLPPQPGLQERTLPLSLSRFFFFFF